MDTDTDTAAGVPAVLAGAAQATAERPSRLPTLALDSLEAQLTFAQTVIDSGLALGHKNAASVVLAINFGAELGLSPMQALRFVQVINGRPALSADAYAGVVLASGKAAYFRAVEETETRATWETRRLVPGDTAPPHDPACAWDSGLCPCGCGAQRYTFTMQDAEVAGLTRRGDMYAKFPGRMLSARAKAFLARDVYPDVVGGVYSDEEVGAFAKSPGGNGSPAAPSPLRRPQARGAVVSAPEAGAGAEAVVDTPPVDETRGEPLVLTAPEAPPPAMLSDSERKEFFRRARHAGKTDRRVREYLKAKYRITSTKALPAGLRDELLAWADHGV